MSRQDVFEMPFEKVYQCLVQKAERKGRTQEEVDQVIKWLTGYVSMDILNGLTYYHLTTIHCRDLPRFAEFVRFFGRNVRFSQSANRGKTSPCEALEAYD